MSALLLLQERFGTQTAGEESLRRRLFRRLLRRQQALLLHHRHQQPLLRQQLQELQTVYQSATVLLILGVTSQPMWSTVPLKPAHAQHPGVKHRRLLPAAPLLPAAS